MIETNINTGILKMTSNLGFLLQEFYIRNKYGSGATISPKILRSEKKLTKDNVDSDRRKQSHGNCGRNTAENILPGASSLEDINKYLNAAKKEKLEQLKKKK